MTSEDHIKIRAMMAEKDTQLQSALNVICQLKGDVAVLMNRLADALKQNESNVKKVELLESRLATVGAAVPQAEAA